ncbi:hypothetical protein F9U64_09675 [Gracilibacillus oryzae]|uniref:Tetratricopeptide repeat protein n=1 Tax=Gracilibacillus oryzae TaxID=1672701 RepID=A0A7C8GT69_9BACI|nr:hypothetical protein [Gracilibacillus oryzae]KAB8136768.1 hypothetical protein F9U64_09675 [Gracilibacillus oryzae]
MADTGDRPISGIFGKVHLLHKQAVAGMPNAVQDALQFLKEARSSNPDNPILKAYHGSTMLLMARDETKPLDRLRWADSGLKLLDEAVNADSDNAVIRLIRGRSSFKLPEKQFQRSSTTIEDYKFVIDQERLGNQILDHQDYLRLMYETGELYYKIGQKQTAKNYWTSLKNKTSDSDFQRLLNMKLAQVEEQDYVEPEAEVKKPMSILISEAARVTGNELQYWANQFKQQEEPKKAEEPEPQPRGLNKRRRRRRRS